MARPKKARTGRELPVEYKLAAVQERLRGTREDDVAKAFGIAKGTITKWVQQFRDHGPDGLKSRRAEVNGRKRKTNSVVRDEVVALKKKNEHWGTRRIRDVLERFAALGVSEQEVRRILHDEGLIESPTPTRDREHPPRRFERATPNQLWQSDIFTFRLRRAERLYVCVFMDDHSRFIVGHSMAHHQKSALVMEAFERGVAAYGPPTEVLTDNGRQYTVWRGKTEFEEQLKRMGIQHIRSRPQHPQTLGKVERFWKTLWDEFLGRTVFAHVVDAQDRLNHFISHYNFQRPHQALDGLVPADRFFKMSAHVRAEIERAVAQNELRLALEQPPRKPFYVVGQLGDQHLSIAAGATGLELHVGGKTETIPLKQLKEDIDATRTSRRFVEEETQDPADAEMAESAIAGGQHREESRPARAVGDHGGEAGDDRDPGGWDLSRLLLPTGDEGAQRHARGAGAGRGHEHDAGHAGPASAAAAPGGQARQGGGGASTRGADARDAPQARSAGSAEDPPWAASEDDNGLDAWWAQKLALLDDDDVDQDAVNESIDEAAGFVPLGELGWRERGPERWERKLAGADATSDNVDDGEEAPDVHAGAGAAGGSRTAPTLHGSAGGPDEHADGEWRSTLARTVSRALPDDLASRDRWDHRGNHAQTGGTTGEAAGASSAGGGEREAQGGARSAADPIGSDREDAGGGRWPGVGEDAAAANPREEDQAGGPRACGDPEASGDYDA
jgi:transposase InsO family protein